MISITFIPKYMQLCMFNDSKCLLRFQGLQQYLDSGKSLTFPDGILVNGQTGATFSGDQGHFLHWQSVCLTLKAEVNICVVTLLYFELFFQVKLTCSEYRTWVCRPPSTLGFRDIK